MTIWWALWGKPFHVEKCAHVHDLVDFVEHARGQQAEMLRALSGKWRLAENKSCFLVKWWISRLTGQPMCADSFWWRWCEVEFMFRPKNKADKNRSSQWLMWMEPYYAAEMKNGVSEIAWRKSCVHGWNALCFFNQQQNNIMVRLEVHENFQKQKQLLVIQFRSTVLWMSLKCWDR